MWTKGEVALQDLIQELWRNFTAAARAMAVLGHADGRICCFLVHSFIEQVPIRAGNNNTSDTGSRIRPQMIQGSAAVYFVLTLGIRRRSGMVLTKRSQSVLAAGLLVMSPVTFGLGFSGNDLAGLPCKGLAQGYGPFDYTNPAHVKNNLQIVERFHFTPEVERLVSGKSGFLLSDLDYTIRAFPNHHRALFALIRFVTDESIKRERAGKLLSEPECYLQRALTMKPKDGKVHLLYGIYLHKLGKLPEAEPYYRNAVKYMPRSAEAHYNLGLLLVDMDRFGDAVPVAKQAYQYGYPLGGLRRRLADAGHPLK